MISNKLFFKRINIEIYLIAVYVGFEKRFRKALGIIYIGCDLSKANSIDKGKICEIFAYLRRI